MSHYRAFFDTQYVGVWDLDGADRIVTIAKVAPGTVGGQQGKAKSKKAIVTLREFEVPFACNVTNARTIAGMYGSDPREWVGKRIALYPTTTSFGGETVDCIRIRPTIPKGEPERVGKRPVDEDVREKQARAAAKAESPGAAIAAATDAVGLAAAIRECAAWVAAHQERVWPRVLARCDELGLPHDEALLAMSEGGAQ